jgi:hypothetical protein|uniref:Putative structural protein n=1 Tax=viral metagenome TaxID=1070528 RepID=A0A6H1ZAW0_9ZZZZ
MSDDAMTIAADAAPMPDAQVSEPAQIDSQPDTRSEPTARGSIEKAFAALESQDKVAAPQDIKPEDVGRERNPDGTFKAKAGDAPAADVDPNAADKPATTFAEAPSRFSPDAKAAWATAPEPVKAEVTRAIKELEGGIQQYQQAFEPYKDFDRQLRANGQNFQEVVAHYTGIEQLLAADPVKGLDQICQNLGTSLRDVAAHIMGQTPDQNASQQDSVIRELRQELSSLKQELGGVSTTIKTQQEQSVLSQIEQFSADKPRFDELSTDIAFFLNNGRAKDLQEAYELAERLNPGPVVAPAPAAPAAPQPDPAHTRKGQLSTTGAPSSGSNPANRKPPASARDAIDRAFAASGF